MRACTVVLDAFGLAAAFGLLASACSMESLGLAGPSSSSKASSLAILVMGAFMKRAGPDCSRLLLLLGMAVEVVRLSPQQTRQGIIHSFGHLQDPGESSLDVLSQVSQVRLYCRIRMSRARANLCMGSCGTVAQC